MEIKRHNYYIVHLKKCEILNLRREMLAKVHDFDFDIQYILFTNNITLKKLFTHTGAMWFYLSPVGDLEIAQLRHKTEKAFAFEPTG